MNSSVFQFHERHERSTKERVNEEDANRKKKRLPFGLLLLFCTTKCLVLKDLTSLFRGKKTWRVHRCWRRKRPLLLLSFFSCLSFNPTSKFILLSVTFPVGIGTSCSLRLLLWVSSYRRRMKISSNITLETREWSRWDVREERDVSSREKKRTFWEENVREEHEPRGTRFLHLFLPLCPPFLSCLWYRHQLE